MLELGWLTAFGEKAIERVVDRIEQLTGRNVDRASPIGMRIARIEAELRILLRACRVDVEVTRANVLALRGPRRVGPQRLIQTIASTSCRERECTSLHIAVVAASIQQKKRHI